MPLNAAHALWRALKKRPPGDPRPTPPPFSHFFGAHLSTQSATLHTTGSSDSVWTIWTRNANRAWRHLVGASSTILIQWAREVLGACKSHSNWESWASRVLGVLDLPQGLSRNPHSHRPTNAHETSPRCTQPHRGALPLLLLVAQRTLRLA